MPRRRSLAVNKTLIALLVRHPLLVLLLFILAAASYGYEVLYARPAMSYLGLPEAQQWQPITWTRVLRNEGFLVGYSDLRGNPLWVIYRLEAIPADARHYRRPQRFERDWRTLNSIGHDDYSGSGFDRGHLAPNYAISRLYGPQAQAATFRMTNITPQRPRLNQKLWQRLEEVEIDVFAPREGELWVITGPIFDRHIERLTSSARVDIPDAFYKIYLVPAHNGTTPRALAFIMPQGVRGDEPLDSYVVSVDEVEARSGFDFFTELDDATETRIEAEVAPGTWRLHEVANLPSRY